MTLFTLHNEACIIQKHIL